MYSGVRGNLSLEVDGLRCKRCAGTIQEADLAKDLVMDGYTYGSVIWEALLMYMVVLKNCIFLPWSVQVCCVVCLYCDALGCRCSCMGSMSVAMQMFVSCVHTVSVLNDAFCINYILLMLVEYARGDHMEDAYCRVSPSVNPILLL